MTGFLYFLGNTLRWPALKPREFLSLHGYLLTIYILTFTLAKNNFNQANLFFTIGILAPLLISIGKGLPLDCLDFKTALIKERENE